MPKKIKDYYYNLSYNMSKLEAKLIGIPHEFLILDPKPNLFSIKQQNKELYALTETLQIRLWIPVFHPYNSIFITQIAVSQILRKDIFNENFTLNEYVNLAYKEYLEFLTILKDNPIHKKKIALTTFFLEHNHKVFIKPHKHKKLKKNVEKFNIFINYWIENEKFIRSLKLPINTIILPDIWVIKIELYG